MIDTASGFCWLEKALEHGETKVVFQSIINKPQGFGIDERRYISVTEFAAQSNRSIHRKGREERKAQMHTSPRFNNHREHRGHREKRHRSVLSVYFVVDRLHSNSFFQNKFKNNKPQMNADKRRFVSLAPAFYNFFFREQIEVYENHPN